LSAAAAFAVLLGVTGCKVDSLTGGELSTDPNNPITATNTQVFVGIQSALWNLWGSDPSRVAGLMTQQLAGTARQYASLANNYAITTNVTNGYQRALYVSGGLIDIKRLEVGAVAAHDDFFLGIGRVLEGAFMGTGADLFGNLVYKEAVSGNATPHLDDQLAVYDSVQTVLSAAVTNLSTAASTSNIGPLTADFGQRWYVFRRVHAGNRRTEFLVPVRRRPACWRYGAGPFSRQPAQGAQRSQADRLLPAQRRGCAD
jgi:hypothetical protein